MEAILLAQSIDVYVRRRSSDLFILDDQLAVARLPSWK